MIQGLQSDNENQSAQFLTQQEIQLIFSDGLDNDRDACGGLRRSTLFGVCLFSAARVKTNQSIFGLLSLSIRNEV
ncbi:hypothetical protein [uncultured Nostoc sp.]|uniref:hypothetical protein n=1 Tax=uncultured Nostoc sp. TaxID=340711 RepID=UPI0035CAB399